MSTKLPASGLARVEQWFAAQGRTPFDFQRQTWREYLSGHDGLIQAPTGVGKTLAAALGPMIEFMDNTGTSEVKLSGSDPFFLSPGTPGEGQGRGRAVGRPTVGSGGTRDRKVQIAKCKLEEGDEGYCPPPGAGIRGTPRIHDKISRAAPLTMIWITPLRALAADTVGALERAIEGLHLRWSIELRTSDTSATLRRRQKERLPTILVTTPESASLLLSYPDSPTRFETLRCVIVDEWHELIGTKRGAQTELALARLRGFAPSLRTWGLSATIANSQEAISALVGPAATDNARSIVAPDTKPILVESILPERIERFPWAGHLGTRMVEPVIERIESAGGTLVFTNTRSQSEMWFRALLQARPQWLGKIALHHGSLDRKLRSSVEQMLRAGELRAVVCTSSLDLGVDFWPVDQVIQIGSPKNIARAIQRAGRSGHQPGATSRLVCVPTQAFELVEFSAVRRAVDRRAVELREPVTLALDVLAQHVATVNFSPRYGRRTPTPL
jgi:ATP-dependent Lhr-like helicase